MFRVRARAWTADPFVAAMTESDILQQGKCISLIGTVFEMDHRQTGQQWNSMAVRHSRVCVTSPARRVSAIESVWHFSV